MPFPFTLPTTSSTSLTDYFSSATHPSLPLTATTQRSVLRDALKSHKRLPATSQASHLSSVNEALNAYLPHLLALHAGITKQRISGERIEVTELKPLETEWRPTLTRGLPGRSEPDRSKVVGLQNEVAFVLQTLAYVQVLFSRTALFTLYATSPPPSQEQRASAIATAMKYLLDANSIYTFALHLTQPGSLTASPADITPTTQSALASLALAEATLITVLKDDPYTAAVVESRNKDSKEWMIRAPSIPKVRAHLFARLSLASADHAAKASALLTQGAAKLDEGLLKYADDLKRTGRAKAARFLGIDAEIVGKTGEAIAWMRGGRKELGFITSSSEDETAKRKGLKGLKQSWAEKREDRKVLKGDTENWGLDAGKLEEGRVLEWLEGKWTKENDTINVQPVPPFEPLLTAMPSGREYHTPKPYTPPTLDPDILARMRAPPAPNERAFTGTEADSGDEDERGGVAEAPVGAFPGTAGEYRTDSPAYY